jgi:hypothetical protein
MVVVRRTDKSFLTWLIENASHQKPMEDTALKSLYALVFVLSSLAATSAQTLDASMIASYYLDDGCEDVIEQSTTPAQMVATEASTEFSEGNGVADTVANDEEDGVHALELSDAIQTVKQSTQSNEQPTARDDIDTTTANDAENAPVGAIQSSDEARAVDYSTEHDDTPAEDGTIATAPAQIVATTEPAIEKLGEANDFGSTAAMDAESGPAGAIQPSDETPMVDYSTLGNDDLTVDDTIALILIDRQLGLSNE